MLMQLGALTFEVWPFNTQSYSRDSGYDFAAKDVMGAQRPREAMGEGDETMTINFRLFPEKLGGLEGLEILNAMRASGTAQILVRGDGKNLGWFLIDGVSEQSSWLDATGVGKIVEGSISLVRSPKPSASSMLRTMISLMRLFG